MTGAFTVMLHEHAAHNGAPLADAWAEAYMAHESMARILIVKRRAPALTSASATAAAPRQ
ncbi:hypothetical protein CHLRE_14g627726v5 [Chlamydomonas reinhardtii]|uniref:Uncharacterized protein n=1 Tax=Chlamydomonas reinhardtii TaxID=3055 RepID=A0A2K3CYH0_CHLRE|nr:uncharacterized protein CHLRE_14g627726v5 [Chlamydomonas reinhardtii]PNW73321.1 hypothetical protein CHLRE_14g627726v5 [Chlamydomonas reinhardtii]